MDRDRDQAQAAPERTPVPAAAVASVATGPLTAARVLALQRTIGNAAVGRVLQRETATDEQRAAAAKDWQRRADAAELIRKYNFLGIPAWLRTEAMGKELVGRLPGDADLAIEVINQLVQGHQDSDASVGICVSATDDQLLAIAQDAGGMRLMFRMVTAMQGITTSDAEKKQLYRAMTAITKARGTTPITVEVITFRSGFAPLDAAGEWIFGKGAKGHTAIAVAGLVYSFDERGWVMEGYQPDYMARNTHRDGIGQVLKIKPEDAIRIQDGLNRSVGTGTYLFDGRVCTDATAQSLLNALGKLNGHHNPQRFADDLAASGNVDKTITYAKQTK